jgi:D-alanyl-D-alanine carboxypeptidase/D-alanyl-D-alanine-endopeptidase (penicillin-binding protein 4)
MPETLQVTNQRSQNFYAEQILKTLGASKYGRGTFDTGRAGVKLYLVEAVGVGEAEFTLSDGSGLSPDNRCSPRALAQVLLHAARQPWAGIYRDSLAVSGESGTLEKRLRGKTTAGKVHGKTGYIGGVSALSGYAETQHHGTWAFSILVNDFQSLAAARKFQDELVQAWIERPAPPK